MIRSCVRLQLRKIQHARPGKSVAMDGGDHHSARCAVFGHQLGHQIAPLIVEGGGRLIQQPERARFDLPFSMKVLLENLLRFEDGRSVTVDDIKAIRRLAQEQGARTEREIAFRPARVLMQDFTGVPAVVDLAAMRDAMKLSAATRRRSTRWCPSISSSTTR
jgi:hypothetical protein